MTHPLARRIEALERRRPPAEALRFVAIIGEHDEAPANATHVVRIVPAEFPPTHVAWVKPNGDAVIALPHNGRDPLPGVA